MYMMSRDAKKADDRNSAPINTFINSQQTGYRRQFLHQIKDTDENAYN